MDPHKVATGLRRIAEKIERSNVPSRVLVSRDLSSVLLHVSADADWEGTDADKVKKKLDEYVKFTKEMTREGESPNSLGLSRDWEEIRGLIQSPDQIPRSKWRDWSLEALQMLEPSLDHMIGNLDLYLNE